VCKDCYTGIHQNQTIKVDGILARYDGVRLEALCPLCRKPEVLPVAPYRENMQVLFGFNVRSLTRIDSLNEEVAELKQEVELYKAEYLEQCKINVETRTGQPTALPAVEEPELHPTPVPMRARRAEAALLKEHTKTVALKAKLQESCDKHLNKYLQAKANAEEKLRLQKEKFLHRQLGYNIMIRG
jgi:hypothetical protein